MMEKTIAEMIEEFDAQTSKPIIYHTVFMPLYNNIIKKILNYDYEGAKDDLTLEAVGRIKQYLMKLRHSEHISESLYNIEYEFLEKKLTLYLSDITEISTVVKAEQRLLSWLQNQQGGEDQRKVIAPETLLKIYNNAKMIISLLEHQSTEIILKDRVITYLANDAIESMGRGRVNIGKARNTIKLLKVLGFDVEDKYEETVKEIDLDETHEFPPTDTE